MMIKKGAMFGLDARIALAIFGALSVISGAALYSAIQQSKVIALVTEINELEKALESYYLDTGNVIPPLDTTNVYYVTVNELVSSTRTGWKGPYFTLPIQRNDLGFDHPTYGYMGVRIMKSDDGLVSESCLDNLQPCKITIVISDIDLSLAKAIDKYIDGTESASNGNLRYFKPGSTYAILKQSRSFKY